MAIPGASLARTALNAPVAATAAASTLAVRGAKAGLRNVPAPKAVNEGVHRVSRAAGALAALAAGGPERHVWAHRGRAHIQASGLSGGGRPHRRYVRALTGALKRLDGVNWAEVNAVTGHVLVGFEEQAVTLGDLIAAVADVEDEHQAGSFDEDAHARRPDDDMAWAAAASVLAADCAAVVAAVTGRLLALPPLPTPVRAAVTVTDAAPHLRAAVEHLLGRTRADALLGIAGAAVNGAGQGVPPLAADAVHRVFRLYEIGARREAWRRREPELAVAGRQPQECGTHAERPCPLPDGPAEKAANRTELGHLLGVSAVLAGTRDPARAGDLPLATVPKAARYGPEAFAAVLAHDLAGRGAVVLQPAALRRLDRIDAVVIDSAALCAREPRLLSAAATGDDPGDHDDPDDAAVWRVAAESLEGRDWDDLAGPGPWPAAPPGGGGAGQGWSLAKAEGDGPADPRGATLDLLDADGTRRGRVQIGCSLDPLAEALIAAAHQAADVVVLTEHASTRELLAWGDDSPVAAADLVEQVQALQREGHGVLAISSGRDRALDAADIGVSVLRGDRPADWRADLVCGPGLGEAWRLLTAVRPARRASERSAELSMSASALGALLLAGRRGRRHRPLSWAELPPVHVASMTAMLTGAVSARRLGHRPLPPPVVRDAWHALTAEEVFRRLSRTAAGSPDGPAAGETEERRPRGAEVAARLAEVPPLNRALARRAGTGARLASAVRQELEDPLTPVLALGAAASAVVGSSVDAFLVAGVMTGNALIGGAQRMRAERALGELMLSQQVGARRVLTGTGAPPDPGDGGFAHLRSADTEKTTAARLRTGDVIRLRSEHVVPADARLLWAESLEVDEAALTGEPVPVDKSVEATPGAAPADRRCMVYEGTTVVAGDAVALVVATAEATEAGRAAALAGTSDVSSSMQARLAELTHQALPATLLGGAAVTALGMLRGLPLNRALDSGVAVAVAAVPEGLPLVATLSQLAAARRLSRLGVLVRSTRALEALGRVDTLCFDKTGTLTEGRLRLVRAAGPARPLPLTGDDGRRILRVAAHASPAHGGRVAHATDRAVLESAGDLPPDTRWALDEELPFEATRGFSASLGRDGDRTVIAVKGAPEVVLAKCTRIHTPESPADGEEPLTPARRRAAAAIVKRLAGEGLRVLAVAEGPGRDRGEIADHIEDLTLLGFVGIADTPRPTAEDAVRRLVDAGVRTTMITGDHPATAAAVAADLGIPDADHVLTGTELDAMSAGERRRAVQRAGVFARVSPAQKVRIVRDLRKAGRVVAMTGDGVNDAAAIARADVGIAVAGRGSGAARTAADLVLTAPDNALILDALREGRALWNSVRDAAAILVGGNAGEVSFTILGTALSGDAPLSTRQLLVVNMLTDMLPALAVALTPADDAAPLGGAPVRGFTGQDMRSALAVRGTATAAAALISWQIGRLTSLVPGGRRRASTMALAALVGAQLGQTLITGRRSPLVIATCVISVAALFAVVETPGLSRFFGCTPLGPGAWAIVTASAAAATAGAAIAPRFLPSAQEGRPPYTR